MLVGQSAASPEANFRSLSGNRYPGRGIIVGRIGGDVYQIYWIMGRSAGSRNRVFKVDASNILRTEPAHPMEGQDTSLTIYNAMRHTGRHYVVSNGAQTDKVIESLESGVTYLQTILRDWRYEPDEPNFTPRITAITTLSRKRHGLTQFSILRQSSLAPGICEQNFFQVEDFPEGTGYCVTTYTGDGDPLPSFRGEPLPMPLEGDMRKIAGDYWSVLDHDNRISLAVRRIDVATGETQIHVENQYRRAA